MRKKGRVRNVRVCDFSQTGGFPSFWFCIFLSFCLYPADYIYSDCYSFPFRFIFNIAGDYYVCTTQKITGGQGIDGYMYFCIGGFWYKKRGGS